MGTCDQSWFVQLPGSIDLQQRVLHKIRAGATRLHSTALGWVAVKCFSCVSVSHYFKAELLSLINLHSSIFCHTVGISRYQMFFSSSVMPMMIYRFDWEAALQEVLCMGSPMYFCNTLGKLRSLGGWFVLVATGLSVMIISTQKSQT